MLEVIATVVLVSAWAGRWWLPRGDGSVALQMVLFLFVASLMLFFGGMAWWWSNGERGGYLLFCGLGTFAAHADSLLKGFLGHEGGTDWPEKRRPPERRRPGSRGPGT